MGGNVGGPDAVARRFRHALDALRAGPLRDLRSAPLYRTAPQLQSGAPPQPDFLNTVAVGTLTHRLAPELAAPGLVPGADAARRLVGWCKHLEMDAGRVLHAPEDAPRPLDVDLLLLGSSRLHLEPVPPAEHPSLSESGVSASEPAPWPGEITVPHPRLRHRRFVLRPLCDLVPDLELPGPGRVTVRQALAKMEADLEAELGRGDGSVDEQRVEVWRTSSG